jgi:hypothetical protein
MAMQLPAVQLTHLSHQHVGIAVGVVITVIFISDGKIVFFITTMD